MIVAFDLHNIRDGGGVNYIRNLLAAADPVRDGFERLVLFVSPEMAPSFPDRPFITKHVLAGLSGGLPRRVWTAQIVIPKLARGYGASILYAPGGIAFGRFRPYATISRNMMPFRRDLWRLYPALSKERLRLHVLGTLNARTFARADAMIFLTESARATITGAMRTVPALTRVVAHGVDGAQFEPGRQRAMPAPDGAIRLVYPSRLEPYKHQVEVLQAVALARATYPNLTIDYLGPANASYREDFERARAAIDPAGAFSRYLGNVPSADLPGYYADSDLLIFASSCENLPNILIEAMSCGIPIICSDAEPMPEVAGLAAIYFSPRAPRTMVAALHTVFADWPATMERVRLGRERSAGYSWERCARSTFALLSQAAASAPDLVASKGST